MQTAESLLRYLPRTPSRVGASMTSPRHSAGLLASKMSTRYASASACPIALNMKGLDWLDSLHWLAQGLRAAPNVQASACVLAVPERADPVRPDYRVYVAIHSSTVAYHSRLFCGLSTQWPSSGNSRSFDGTFCVCRALKNSRLCVYGTR